MADAWDSVGTVVKPAKAAAEPSWDSVGSVVKPAKTPAPKPIPAPAPKPVAAAPKPAPAPKPSAWDAVGHVVAGVENSVGKAFQAAPGSAWNAAKGIYETVRHPIQSAQAISDLGLGAAEAGIRAVTGRDMKPKRGETADTAAARRVPHAQAFKPYQDSYGSLSGLKKKFETDPVGLALDASVVAGGATGLAGRLGKAGDAAEAGRAASVADKALKPTRELFTPGKVDEHSRRLAPIQRQVLARHRLDAERAAAQLEKHQRVVGNLPVEDQRGVIHAVESASGGGIGKLPEHLQPAARAIRDVSVKYRARIENVLKKSGGAGPSFVEDYYARMWKQDPKEVSAAMTRQGSGRNLKQRTIPTYQDGLDAGLTPVHENPLDGMTAYVDNMSRYLSTHNLQGEMRANGLAKWVPKQSIPEGWAKLNGMNTERAAKPLTKEIDGLPVLTGTVGERVLAAPESAARMYNNYLDTGLKGPLLKGYEKAANAQAGVKLAGSLFHPVLVAGKGVASDLATGVNHLLRGQPVEAAKSLLHMPVAPVATALEGRAMGKRLLSEHPEDMTPLDHLFVDSGGRVSGDQIYRSSIKPDFLKSAFRGTFARDLKDAMKSVATGPMKQRAGAIADLAGRAFDTFNAPVFRYYVPAMKRGVFEREMTAELSRNPDLPLAEQKALARKVLDNIDGRMGEMVRDNNFWSQTQMQLAKLAFLSPSWQIGDVRIVTDAIKDMPASVKGLAKGKGLEHGTAQALGLVGSYFLMNGVANYLYTGQAPTGEDWVAFRTGGQTSDGTPERAAIPSVMKDFFGAAHDPMQELVNKLHPTPRMFYEIANNRDWKNDPIVKPAHATVDPDASRFLEAMDYLGDQFSPIGFNANPNGKNSGIGTGGKIMGLRPSGMAYTNPDRLEGVERYRDNKAWNAKLRHDRKAQQRKEAQ